MEAVPISDINILRNLAVYNLLNIPHRNYRCDWMPDQSHLGI